MPGLCAKDRTYVIHYYIESLFSSPRRKARLYDPRLNQEETEPKRGYSPPPPPPRPGVLLALGSWDGKPGGHVFSKGTILPSLVLALDGLSSRPELLKLGKYVNRQGLFKMQVLVQ